MKLLELYTHILEYCNMVPNQAGEIDIVTDQGTDPATIDGKRLVLPTPEQQRKYSPDKIVFHPLQEYVNRGESEVVKKLRRHLNIRINLATITIAEALLQLAASRAVHASLSPEQRELLKAIQHADLKSGPNFVTFIGKAFVESPVSAIANLYLKKAGTYKGEKHACVGIVTFPYYELFNSAKIESLRKIDQTDFLKLMEFIFPSSRDDVEAYNAFSDSKEAPRLEAVLKASYTLADRLNELLDLYADHIPNAEKLRFNSEWVDALENIDQFRSEISRIPVQKGNEGALLTEDGQERTTAKTEPAPVAARPTPADRSTEEVVDPYRRADPAPRYNHPPTHLPTGYPPAAYPPPGYPPAGYPPGHPGGYPVNAAPALRHTESGKLDFRSVESVNPAVAMAGLVQTPLSEWAQRQDPRYHQQQMYPSVDPRLGGRAIAPSYNTGAGPGYAYSGVPGGHRGGISNI